jgi:hypothetical protein
MIMNIKFARRILSLTLAACLMAAPLTVGATDTPSQGSTTTSPETSQQATEEEVVTIPTSMDVVDGTEVIPNKLPGAFWVPSSDPAIEAICFRETPAAISSKASLAAGARPFSRVYSIYRSKSTGAYACFDAAAKALGGKTIGGFNVDFGYLANGQYTKLPEGVTTTVTIKIKDYDPNAKYYIARVTKAGKTEIIPLKVNKYGVASFEVVGGLGGYGLIQA